jgi:hypothetical protein
MLERVEMTRRNVVVDGKVYSVKRESEQGVQFAQPEIVSGPKQGLGRVIPLLAGSRVFPEAQP